MGISLPHRQYWVEVFACLLVLSASHSALAQLPAKESPLERGVALIREERPAEAIVLLKDLTKREKTNAEAWYYLGVAYSALTDFKKAASAFETAIKLRPQFPEAHTAFSYSLLRRGKLREASDEVEKALAQDPKSRDDHYTMGVIKLRSGQRDEALQHADFVIKADPRFAEAYLLRSQALVSFNGDAIVLGADVSRQDRSIRYGAAAESLEKYLQLSGNSRDNQVWNDQLESLRFYMIAHGGQAGSGDYYSGGAVTTKARLISKPEPTYTDEARNGQIAGVVILRCVFASDGTVKHILVLKSLPGGLTQQAVKAAQRIKFVPATIDGKPVSMFMQLEYNFNLY